MWQRIFDGKLSAKKNTSATTSFDRKKLAYEKLWSNQCATPNAANSASVNGDCLHNEEMTSATVAKQKSDATYRLEV